MIADDKRKGYKEFLLKALSCIVAPITIYKTAIPVLFDEMSFLITVQVNIKFPARHAGGRNRFQRWNLGKNRTGRVGNSAVGSGELVSGGDWKVKISKPSSQADGNDSKNTLNQTFLQDCCRTWVLLIQNQYFQRPIYTLLQFGFT